MSKVIHLVQRARLQIRDEWSLGALVRELRKRLLAKRFSAT